MRRILMTVFVLLMGIGISPIKAGGPDTSCQDQLPSHLHIDKQGVVLPGPANNVRAEPSTSATLLGAIPEYGIFTVLDGPECVDQYVWWQVDYDGLQGWTVEGSTSDGYYLTRIDDDGNPVEYGENRDQAFYGAESEAVHADEEDRFTFRGISVTIPDALDTIDGTALAAINPYNTASPFWEVTPGYIHLVYDEEYYFSIEVFSAEAYDAYHPGAIEHLRTQLDERPETGVGTRDLWLINAAIMMRARPAYLETPWGTMYRDLRHYAQALMPIPQSFGYYAVGLTSDDHYFIRVQSSTHVDMPQELLDVGQSAFPHEASEEEQHAYTEAILQAQEDGMVFLNAAPPDAFMPSLEAIDAIVASLEISPEADNDEWQIPPELIDFPRSEPTTP